MAIAFVNRTEGYTGAPVAALSAAAANHSAGNLLWVWANVQNAGATPVVTDTALNTYTMIGSPFQRPGNSNWLVQFYAKNITGNASNIVIITTPTSGYTAIGVRQFSGCDLTAPLITSATGSGSGTALATSSLAIAQSAVICAGMEADGQGLVAGSGYTLTRVSDGLGSYTADEYHLVSASEAATATAGSGPWTMVAAAFAAATAGGKIPQGLFRSMAR